MRKLALSDEILMQVDKPARYIGNELNSVMKDTSQVDIRFAMCFPDVYEIGMSHLGIQILYDMFNRREDVYCPRRAREIGTAAIFLLVEAGVSCGDHRRTEEDAPSRSGRSPLWQQAGERQSPGCRTNMEKK